MAVFAAIELDDAARAIALHAMEAVAKIPDVRLERPEKLHVTLAYVGQVDAVRVPLFADALRQAARACQAFDVVFDELGGFGNKRRPGVIAYACSAPQVGYLRCAASLRAAFEILGATFEHDALPHVTLARCKHRMREVTSIPTPQPLIVAARKIVLLESVPAGPTTRYELRASASLRAADLERGR
ncbi:MAG: RNA 2',3'-cyclic phosphodiesterase [Candidatus Eremiobacteraeota bacterium]|nr:RNA 2',3'-cyclic phosphodiesterase [Candidatus Eremiobacteraeota bacterium]MBV8366500.1 RNA 2',3'-cyclic phosphodiesterase [Candidatus Eremiobacteraeota bacterium]